MWDGFVVIDDNLGSNQKTKGPFFTRGRHKESVVLQVSNSYADLSERTKRKSSNKFVLSKRTLEIWLAFTEFLLYVMWNMTKLKELLEKSGNRILISFVLIII